MNYLYIKLYHQLCYNFFTGELDFLFFKIYKNFQIKILIESSMSEKVKKT